METIEIVDRGDVLGEGPVWDGMKGHLSRVDTPSGRIIVLDTKSAEHDDVIFAGAPLGFALPRTQGGFVVGVGLDIILIDADGTQRTLAAMPAASPDERINDAACDAVGRLWAGTMSLGAPGSAGLYRIGPDGHTTRVLDGVTISNGLDWSPAGDRLYYADTATQRIDVLDFDCSAGSVANRRALVHIEASDGTPDGIAVDTDGGVWVALYGGGAVRRYNSDGSLDLTIKVPVTCPTSVAFGGAELDQLYITTSRFKLTPQQRREQPAAGSLLRYSGYHTGIKPSFFAG